MGTVGIAEDSYFLSPPSTTEAVIKSVGVQSLFVDEDGDREHTAFEGNDLWCGTAATLPKTLSRGSTYTLYRVWGWLTPIHLPELPFGKLEIYTTCLDISIL